MAGFEVIGAEELQEIQEVFDSGAVLFRHSFEALRNGCFKVQEFEESFANYMGAKHALAVSSGTAALRVALAALDIGPGDEVITQSFTFVATVEAIVESGATPICGEIDDSLNLDPNNLEQLITSKTKAVIVVHMLGVPANLPRIIEICERNNVRLIEDTAWGCGGKLNGKALGTWGDIGAFSFDFAKTMTTGEGGMLTFQSSRVFEKAAAWHDHGHENNPSVPRWEDTRSSSGFNFRMMELQGAVGLAQLKKLSDIVSCQRRNRDLIWDSIKDLELITLRSSPDGAFDTADALIFFVRNNKSALKCREELLKVGMSTKILPEAYSWHFAGTWHHIKELRVSHGGDLTKSFQKSAEKLSRAVSIPVGVNMEAEVPETIHLALTRALFSQ